MAEDKSNLVFCSGLVRLAFVSVFKPKKQPNKDQLKYEVTCLIPKGDKEALKPFLVAAKAAIVGKWGTDRAKWPANLRALDLANFLSMTGKDGWPFRDGDAQPYDGFAGMVSIKCSNERKVQIVDKNRNPVMDEEEVYSGMFGQVLGVAYAWDQSGNRGVSFSLDAVRKIKDGEPFVRRADVSAFEGYDDMDDGQFDDVENF
jgi:hypothetical protein